MDIIVADSHLHSNPVKGLGAGKIAAKLKQNGGWFAALVMLPSWDYGELAQTVEKYLKYVDLHIGECKKARETGLTVKCFAGFHPAEIDRLLDRGMEPLRVLSHAEGVIQELFKLCDNGLLDGVGELGRQHYKTRPTSVIIADRLLSYALTLARDHGCPLQFHLENVKGFTVYDMWSRLSESGLLERSILHHLRTGVVEEALKRKMWATTPGIYGNLEALFRRSPTIETLLIESDYIDDPKRPGAVVEPWTFSQTFFRLVDQGIIGLDDVHRIFVDNVVKFFRVTPP